MVLILRTSDGKKVIVNKQQDVCLYSAPANPPNTSQYTSGTDLFCHKAKSGNVYFYTYRWSMWEGTEDSFELISEEDAKEFILERAALAGWAGIEEYEWERIIQCIPDICEEDA